MIGVLDFLTWVIQKSPLKLFQQVKLRRTTALSGKTKTVEFTNFKSSKSSDRSFVPLQWNYTKNTYNTFDQAQTRRTTALKKIWFLEFHFQKVPTNVLVFCSGFLQKSITTVFDEVQIQRNTALLRKPQILKFKNFKSSKSSDWIIVPLQGSYAKKSHHTFDQIPIQRTTALSR